MFLFDCMLDRLFSMCLPLSLSVPHTHTHAITYTCSGAGADACPNRCEFRGVCHHSNGHRGRYPSPCRIPHRHHSICKLQRYDEHLHGAHHRRLHFWGEPQLYGGRCGHGDHQDHCWVNKHRLSVGRGGRSWDLYREHSRGSHHWDNSRDARQRQLPQHDGGHHQRQWLLQLYRAADSVIEFSPKWSACVQILKCRDIVHPKP